MSTNTPESPITVTVDHDPRGVSVGVWQGSHCIYSGAHPLPAAADASTAAHTYGAPAEVAARIEHYLTHNGQENSASLLLYEAMKALRAPAAGDARGPNLDIEAAAKTLAECMDYPWVHMPEQGRAAMREHAQTVIRAASQQQEG